MDESTQNPSGNSQDAEGAAGLRELALRLAMQRVLMFGGMTGEPREPQLFVGHVPAGFPFEPPLPPGGRVVGGVAGDQITEVFLDAGEPASAVLAFYREQLGQRGWEPLPFPPMNRGGFVASGFGFGLGSREMFCQGEQPAVVSVWAVDIAGKPTDVRLDLNTYATNPEQSPCRQRRRMHERRGAQMWDIFPALTPPGGAQQRPEGGGGGGDRWQTSAVLQGDVMLAAVRTHYEGQLQDAGWMRTESGEGSAVAWSRWTFTDQEQQPWRGTFLMLQQSEAPRSYFLLLRAEAANRQFGFSPGGFSYAPLTSGSQSATRNIVGHSGETSSPGGGPQQSRTGGPSPQKPNEGPEKETGTQAPESARE